MYEIFEQLRHKKGISVYRVSKDTGVSQATLSAWKAGEYTPKQDKLQKIADYFDVSLDYLLGNKQKNKPSANAESLSDIENEILEIYHNLPEDKKQTFITVARSLKSRPEDK
jgi:transcriptional regulator with XRE-family HTH domain